MSPPSWFFNLLAEFDAVSRPQDAGGGEVPTPAIAAILVPCCVQASGPSLKTDTQAKRGSETTMRVFLAPANAQALALVRALKVGDRLKVQGYPNPLILDGNAVDQSGRGYVFEAPARDRR